MLVKTRTAKETILIQGGMEGTHIRGLNINLIQFSSIVFQGSHIRILFHSENNIFQNDGLLFYSSINNISPSTFLPTESCCLIINSQ